MMTRRLPELRGYDHWKTTNPDDEWLGPEPEDDMAEEEPREPLTDEQLRAFRQGHLPYVRDMAAELLRLRARVARLEGAVEPFARNARAKSLSEALGHIEREHLLAARAALKEFTPVKTGAPQ